jgi:signal transduction histidine kinase
MTGATSRFSAWSLRRRVGAWFITLSILLVLAFATLLFALLQLKSKGDELIDRWQPAYTLSQQLLSDMVNEETGLRGFVLGKREIFLEPYNSYSKMQVVHERKLRALLAGRPDLTADLDRFDAQASSWRRHIADRYIREVRAGDPNASDLVNDLAAKNSFDQVRARSGTLTDHVQTAGNDVQGARRSSVIFALVSAVVAACLTLGSKYLLWRGLQHQVLDPIDELAGQTQEVARGAIDKQIVPSGPPEIAGLGRDVDSMRAQIANELVRVERARQVLIERSEELSRSNADLEQFAYVASHDLSEPLRKVANFCQLLERQYADQLDDKARQYIAFAVDGAKRMQVLITDLLAFSRVGRTTESFEAVDMNRALDRALATLDERITSSSAQIVRGPLPTVDGDPTLLSALFQNLVGNSLKYRSPDRAPRIELSADQQSDGQWLFTITDNGIGIDPQYSERIFTIFQRLHLRDKYGGTGIGLALCRKIVEFHRGKIWLGQNEGPGATFQFLIPEHAQTGPDLTQDLVEAVDRNEYRTDARAGSHTDSPSRGGRSG